METGRIDVEDALARRDLRSVCWYIMGELLLADAAAPPKFGPVAASMARVLLALGEEANGRAELLEEAAVIGSVLHGLPPETPEQWAVAERLYPAPVIRQLHQWERRRRAAGATGSGP